MKNKKFNPKIFALFLILFLVLVIVLVYFLFMNILKNNSFNNESIAKPISRTEEKTNVEKAEFKTKNEYALTDNDLSKFDLSFLKFEDNNKNIIYSPLSIKYAFKMLEEGTANNSKEQISSIINTYNLTKYNSNKNMALANAFFIRDSYKNSIKSEYVDKIKANYNADIKFDSFANAQNINEWVNENTLGMIKSLYEDSDVSNFNFALVNSLGIDMEWNHKFLEHHYDDDKNITDLVEYSHENVSWETAQEVLYKLPFDNKKSDVSSMKIEASLNNYDIVKELGEDKIKETVKNDFFKWAKSDEVNYVAGDLDEYFHGDFSDAGIEKAFEKYWEEGNESYLMEELGKEKGYLSEIKQNYGKVDYSTDFSIFVDDSVKVFSKDLKDYNGTTLQYIGIMPQEKELDDFIKDTSEEEIKDLIGKLKDLKLENFKDGVVTRITGYIPKFKFDYELNLQEDLEKLGITDIFELGNADLTNLTDDRSTFIGSVKHKANIEFTQDGIKAAAATGVGGLGAGEFYNYIFEIPTEVIDITFDKPYMFIIKDKEKDETWFVGAVYEPLNAADENSDIYEIYDY